MAGQSFRETARDLKRREASPPESEGMPFIAGPPISHPRRFFGREKTLKRLFNLWRRPPLQNAAVIGPKRSGKTSLLHYLRNITTNPKRLRPGQRTDWLPQPDRHRWIYVDFQDARVGSREGLLRHLLVHLELPVPEPCDLERFLDLVSSTLRDPAVILFDEIDVALDRYKDELDNAFWESLRSLACNLVEGNLGFVLTAREGPGHVADRHDAGSPFFNIFGYTATLGPLAEPEARELIASSSIPFPPGDVEWILVQSGLWPYLLQILCRERLIALEEGEDDSTWQAEGLRQIAPFRASLPTSSQRAKLAQPLVDPLSHRELDVLRHIEEGLDNQQIADKLVIAISTVKTHINNIYGKLGVRKRTQAIARAKELGLL